MERTTNFVKEILPHELRDRLAVRDNVRVIDVREAEEVEEGMIPQAEHIPLFLLGERYLDLDPREEIVVVCRTGRRSLAACKALMVMGFSNVKNMIGGMTAWNEQSCS